MTPEFPPDDEPVNWFDVLNSIDCTGHVEMKDVEFKSGLTKSFPYLAWPFVVQTMTHFDPAFDWGLRWRKYADDVWLPYVTTPIGVFVEVYASFQGKEISHLYPVLGYDNNAIPVESITPFEINTSQMRGLVKVCAMHGLGLYIFAGEKTPGGDCAPAVRLANEVRALLNEDLEQEVMAEKCLLKGEDMNKDQDLLLAAWKYLSAKERSTFKKYVALARTIIESKLTGEVRQ